MNFMEDIDWEYFTMCGEAHLEEFLNDIWYDVLPAGWKNHYVDEVHDVGDGFTTIVNFNGEKILYHIFVDPDFESQGIGTQMLLDEYENGVRKIFDPNDACISLIQHVEANYDVEFEICRV